MKIFAILVLMIISDLAYSQANWFPAGARWTYNWSSFGAWGYITMDVLPGDTTLSGRTYKKIIYSDYLMGIDDNLDSIVTELMFFYEEADRVYIGNRLLYDFTAGVGDTLEISAEGLSEGPFIVDSVGIIEVNGVSLRFQDIEFPELFNPAEYYSMRVLEKVGILNTHFLYYLGVIQPPDAPFYYLQCYTDEELGDFRYGTWPVDCDQINLPTSLDENQNDEISVYPNPFQNEINISTHNPKLDKVALADITGQVRMIQKIDSHCLNKIDVNTINPGFYILYLLTEQGDILFKEKMIK